MKPPQEKQLIERARDAWQAQCKASFQGVPFRDKTAKACYERIKKESQS